MLNKLYILRHTYCKGMMAISPFDMNDISTGVVDSSGIRIFYTENLREYDSGTLMLGQTVFPSIVIPPGQPRFLVTGFCDTTCTQQVRLPLLTAQPL